MIWGVLADVVMAMHFLFTTFVVAGGLLALRWPRAAWIHLPVLAYGVAIEVVGWVCPLTPLEWKLRAMAGEAGYAGGFLERYLGPVLYPSGWEHLRWTLAAGLVTINVAVYGPLLVRRIRRKRSPGR